MIVQSSGQPQEFISCAELTGRQGFVVAPFAPSETEPILLIRPDVIERGADITCLRQLPQGMLMGRMKEAPHQDYHIDFANFHAHLVNGEFQKLVLSRSVDIKEERDFVRLFQQACVPTP